MKFRDVGDGYLIAQKYYTTEPISVGLLKNLLNDPEHPRWVLRAVPDNGAINAEQLREIADKLDQLNGAREREE